jgi:Predicted GTPase or GTP-binding protein
MLVKKGIDYITKGPCKLTVVKGRILIKGIEINEKEYKQINEESFSIVPKEESEIDTDCQILAEIPHLGWEELASQMSGGKVLLLGSTDSGKSYFSDIIHNMNKDSVIIDADVGQSRYLPTFISSTSGILEFFGDVSPSRNYRLHIELIGKILDNEKHSLTIIDTDGWIRGYKAFLHKLYMIYELDPDFIVSFDDKIVDYFPSNIRKKVIIVKKIPPFLERSRAKRISYRISKYKKYFEKASIITIEYEQVLGKKLAEGLFVGFDEPLQLFHEEPCSGYFIEELLGGLAGIVNEGKIAGAGIIKEINQDGVKILTPVNKVQGAILGNISLNEEFKERRIRFSKC